MAWAAPLQLRCSVCSPCPQDRPYTLLLTGTNPGSVDLSVTVPAGDGSFFIGTATGVPVATNERMKVVLDLSTPGNLILQQDTSNDGSFSTLLPLTVQRITAQGATLLSATVVGPETLPGASPFGFHVAALFDRPVDPNSSATTTNYQIPLNSVQAAKSQLSGRLVLADLAQPEGPYVPTTLGVSGIADLRGVQGPSVTVPLQSRLLDPGAVVSGRVINADGTLVTSGLVTYINIPPMPDCNTEFPPLPAGFAAVPLTANGQYQFRYVRQGDCGRPFTMAMTDPNTGAANQITAYVRSAGQQLVLDFVLFGRGSVSGIVRDIGGNPVGGAQVVAVSVTNPQIGGAATTDGNGRYTITGITVGQVTVTAGYGTGLGYELWPYLSIGNHCPDRRHPQQWFGQCCGACVQNRRRCNVARTRRTSCVLLAAWFIAGRDHIHGAGRQLRDHSNAGRKLFDPSHA